MQTDLGSTEALAAELRLLRRSLEKLEGLVRAVGVSESCSACGAEARLDVGDPNFVSAAAKYAKTWRSEHACKAS